MTDPLLSADGVAELLAVPVSWVRDATRDGRLPAIRLGRYVRYRESSIVAWLDNQEMATPRQRAYDPRRGQPGR